MVTVPIVRVLMPENGLDLAVMKALSGTDFNMVVERRKVAQNREAEVIVFRSNERVVIEKHAESGE